MVAVCVMVAALLRVTLPELTRLLLIAPWKKRAPVLVTAPLKKVLAVTATVAALLKLLLTPAPVGVLESTLPGARRSVPPNKSIPFKSNRPAVMLAVVIVASPFNFTVPELASVLLIAPARKSEPVLVTGPLKKVLAVTATVAALLRPPLKLAPATLLVKTPVLLTTIRPLV